MTVLYNFDIIITKRSVTDKCTYPVIIAITLNIKNIYVEIIGAPGFIIKKQHPLKRTGTPSVVRYIKIHIFISIKRLAGDMIRGLIS